jgi:hypothetical protein
MAAMRETNKLVDTSRYYNYFMKKYTEYNSLFMQHDILDDVLKKNIEDKINAIIKYIFSIILKGEQRQYVKSLNVFIEHLLLKAISIKINSEIIPANIYSLLYHGRPIYDDIITIPDKCILCILTPLGRTKIADFENILTYVSDFQKPDMLYRDFINNPVCFRRNEFNGLYSDSSVYFPGQYCHNIKLTFDINANDTDIHPKYFGVWKFNAARPNGILQEPFKNITYLKDLLEENKETGGIFFLLTCRDLNEQISKLERKEKVKALKHTRYLKNYETLLNILNKSVYFLKDNNGILSEDDEGYKKCDYITSIGNNSLCIKSIDIYHIKNNKNSIPLKKLEQTQLYLNSLSKKFGNANSSTIKTFLRMPVAQLLNPIIEWLCSHNPKNDSMRELFAKITTYSVKIKNRNNNNETTIEIDMISYENIINLLGKEKFTSRNLGALGTAIEILNSYVVYKNIIKQNNKYFEGSTLYLNGLNIGLEDLVKNPCLVSCYRFYKNIYLRNNMISGIFCYVADIINDNNIYLDGNPIELYDTENVMKTLDIKLPLIDINFLLVYFIPENLKIELSMYVKIDPSTTLNSSKVSQFGGYLLERKKTKNTTNTKNTKKTKKTEDKKKL